MEHIKRFETEAIRTQTARTGYSEHSTPLFLTSSFIFDDAEDMRASFAEEKDKTEILRALPSQECGDGAQSPSAFSRRKRDYPDDRSAYRQDRAV